MSILYHPFETIVRCGMVVVVYLLFAICCLPFTIHIYIPYRTHSSNKVSGGNQPPTNTTSINIFSYTTDANKKSGKKTKKNNEKGKQRTEYICMVHTLRYYIVYTTKSEAMKPSWKIRKSTCDKRKEEKQKKKRKRKTFTTFGLCNHD